MFPLRSRPIYSVSPSIDPITVATADGSAARRILVVGDIDALRATVVRTLAAEGYVVIEARHGEIALRLIEQAVEPFSLVITDVMMPVMSGYKLGRRLATYRPELPVLYMSASPHEAPVRQGQLPSLPPGLMPRLRKPFLPDELTRAVAFLLEPLA